MRSSWNRVSIWPLSTFILLVAAGAVLWKKQTDNQREKITLETRIVADQVMQRLQDWIDTRVSMIARYAGEGVRLIPPARPASFGDTLSPVEFIPGVNKLKVLSDQDLAERGLPANLDSVDEGDHHPSGAPSEETTKAFEAARDTGLARRTKCESYGNKGRGFSFFWPIFSESGRKPIGYLNGSFLFQDIAEACLSEPTLMKEFRLGLSEPDGTAAFGVVPGDPSTWPYHQQLELKAFDSPLLVHVAPSARHLESYSSPIKTLLFLGLLGTAVTISLLLRSHLIRNTELAASEAQVRSLLNSTGEGIFGLDMEGCCTFCNATGLQLLRYDRAIELQGCNMHEAILHSNAEEQLIPRRDAELFNCLQEGRPVHSDSDVFWRADNTSFPVEFRSHPVTQDGRLKGAVVTFTDISARQQADKAQELLELQFHQSQKLESLGLLAGGIAHDFNNLLVGILGNTTLIQQDLPEGSPHASQLAIIAKSAERASELTTQLMNYSGRRHLRAQSVDLVDLVEEMSHLLNSSISKSAELNLDLAKDMTRVAGDATQLRQVIMNLITNASDALEDQRGTIRIRVAMSTPPPPTLNGLILGTPPDASPSCLVEVCDSGVGMTSETQKRIFDPFFTTRSKGRGLGLSAVLGIISGHGGSIHLKSELEKGTCISICLPPSTLPEEPVSRVTQSSATQRPTLEAITVMVVDDEPLVREVVIKILTRAGHQVITASTGEESVQKFEENGDRIDIVMMDLTMPGISGIQAAHKIRLLDPNIPIVISSGHTKERSNIDIPKLAPLEFLGKPFKANALLNALSRVIELHGSKRE